MSCNDTEKLRTYTPSKYTTNYAGTVLQLGRDSACGVVQMCLQSTWGHPDETNTDLHKCANSA